MGRSQTYRRPLRWTDVVKTLALPPAGLFWLAFLGLGLALGGFVKVGIAVVSVTLGALYLLAVPSIGNALLARLDRHPPLGPQRVAAPVPTVLVVLDAGRRIHAREYGGDGLKPMTLERLAYAAWLWRSLGLPLLVTGNGAGALMSTYMGRIFGVPVRWIEPASHNTHESAVRSAEILRGDGIERIVLITHFWHMPRAVAAFARTGLEVVPAPMGFSRRLDNWERGLLAFVPSVQALRRSHLAVHEGIGLLWYRWSYGDDP